MIAPPIELRFPADHPSGAGHFPANPMIPGALLLDCVVQALAALLAGGPVVIRVAKFLRPVRPGESLRLEWGASPGGGIMFECHLPGGLAASGILEAGPAA